MDRLSVYANVIRQQVIGVAVSGLKNGHPRKSASFAAKNLVHIVRDRLLPIEAWSFGDDLEAVRVRRDTLYLQIEHRTHLRHFWHAIRSAALNDKALFAQFCEQHSLPHPATELLDLTHLEPAQLLSAPEHSDFIIKPATGSGGDGVMALRHRTNESWQLHLANDDLREGSLDTLLTNACSTGKWIIQPAIANAPELAEALGPGLATFRTISAPTSSGGVEVVSMLAELPLDNALPMPHRWLVLPVDPSTGVFAQMATKTRDQLGEHISGEVMELFQRPLIDAPSLAKLAVRAHETLLSQYPHAKLPPMIGWDLALGQDGPIVLEPNWNWSVATHYSNAAGLDFALSERFARTAALHALP